MKGCLGRSSLSRVQSQKDHATVCHPDSSASHFHLITSDSLIIGGTAMS